MILHRLPLTAGHVMHVEEHGNPAGLPVLLLHGGPGSGSSPLQRSFFDPDVYRILCPDQRGAGQSTPRGSIEHNTLQHLLADLRLLRAHLQVDRWLVVGGSWGATLALLHALDQPDAVAGLLLRNVFLARPVDIAGFFAAATNTQVLGWAALQRQADAARCSLVESLADLFATGGPAAQREAAACWWRSEQILSGDDHAPTPGDAQLEVLADRYRIQSHYLRHGCWIAPPGLLARCDALPAVPTLILQGTEDAMCPPGGALALAHACGARAALRLVPGAGHDPRHPAMAEAMRQALQAYARSRSFAAACDRSTSKNAA
ncbi:MAG TPA: alpha/beta fold hydrolase [Ramlibacter sp.]|uniref:alpha/beta fold hydrolase n=1 Tax=Ramlibacter sp. TaxID=1917967 RepID=UPI002ED2FFE5